MALTGDDAYLDEAMALVEAVQAVERDRKGNAPQSFATALLDNFGAMTTFADHGTARLREVLKFFQKRKTVESDYAKALGKLHQSMLKAAAFDDISSPEYSAPMYYWKKLGSHKAWQALVDDCRAAHVASEAFAARMEAEVIAPTQQRLKELETRWNTLLGRGREMIQELHEGYKLVAKEKSLYDEARHDMEEANTQASLARNNHKAKAKEVQKAQAKYETLAAKTAMRSRALEEAESRSRWLQKKHYFERMPTLLHTFQNYEIGRCANVKKIYLQYAKLTSDHLEAVNEARKKLCDEIEGVQAIADVEQCIQEHSQQVVRSVMSLIDPDKTGRAWVHRRNADASFDGKPIQQYLVLMAKEQRLYFFDREDSISARGFVNLPQGPRVLHVAHPSMLEDYPHTFIISVPNAKSYVISLDEEFEVEEWLRALKPVTSRRKSGTARTVAILSMEVSEGKLPSKGEFHCLLGVDGEALARTKTCEATNNPFWGENFIFDDLPGETETINLYLKKGSKDSNVKGTVVVPTSRFCEEDPQIVEWFPAMNAAGEEYGTVRLRMSFETHMIRPIWHYEPLIEIACTPEFLHTFNDILQPLGREQCALNLLRVYAHRGTVTSFLKDLIRMEVSRTDNANVIFRGNSLTTKVIDQFMKMVGLPYLKLVLQRVVAGVYQSKSSCEVDPTVCPDEKTLQQNRGRLLAVTQNFWDAIIFAEDHVPKSMKRIFHFIRVCIAERFGADAEHVKYTSVSGFLFLRFIVPAVLSPKQFDVMTDPPKETAARTLKFVAKTLQNLGNLVQFGSKEPFMECMNPFIQAQLPRLKEYIDMLSDPEYARDVRKRRADEAAALAAASSSKRSFFSFGKSKSETSLRRQGSSDSLPVEEEDDEDVQIQIEQADPAADAAAVHAVFKAHEEAFRNDESEGAKLIIPVLDALALPVAEFEKSEMGQFILSEFKGDLDLDDTLENDQLQEEEAEEVAFEELPADSPADNGAAAPVTPAKPPAPPKPVPEEKPPLTPRMQSLKPNKRALPPPPTSS